MCYESKMLCTRISSHFNIQFSRNSPEHQHIPPVRFANRQRRNTSATYREEFNWALFQGALVTGFPSPCSRKIDVKQGAAKKKNSQEETCKGVLNPFDTDAEAGVASALVRWGISVCVRHWCSSDPVARGVSQDSTFPSEL